MGHELRYGQALLIITGWPDGHYVEFPIDACFDHLLYAWGSTGQVSSVADVLDACMDSVEMVVSRLRQEL